MTITRHTATGIADTKAKRDEVWPHGAPAVGQRAERSRSVSADDIVRFTEISGDRNPLHYDRRAAAKTRFGEVVVQGGVTSAILNAVVAEDLPGPGTVFTTQCCTKRYEIPDCGQCAQLQQACTYIQQVISLMCSSIPVL